MDFLRNRMFRATLCATPTSGRAMGCARKPLPPFKSLPPLEPVSAQPDLAAETPEDFKGAKDLVPRCRPFTAQKPATPPVF